MEMLQRAGKESVCVCECECAPPLWLTAAFAETLVADLAQALKALVEVLHLLLQVRVLLVQHVLLGVALRRGDHVLVDLCRGEGGANTRW